MCVVGVVDVDEESCIPAAGEGGVEMGKRVEREEKGW